MDGIRPYGHMDECRIKEGDVQVQGSRITPVRNSNDKEDG